jgi:tetratricopeptide (TPR) repeat protein
MQTAREALPRPLTIGIPGTLLPLASATLLAAALFYGGGSRDERVTLIGATAVLVAGVALAAAWLGLLPLPTLDRWARAFLVLLGAIVVWSGLGLWWSIAPDLTWRYANRGLAYGAFCVLGLLVAVAIPRAVRVVAAGFALLVAAVIGWALAGKIAPALYEDSFRFARLRDPLEYWNALALVAGMGIPLALWVAASRVHSNVVRALGALLLFATTVALLLTYSRGGVAVAVVAVAFWLVLTDRRLEGVAALVIGGVPALVVSAWAFGRPGLSEDGQPYSVRFDDGVRFGVVLAVVGALVFGLAFLASRYEERRPPTPELAHRVLRWSLAGAAVAAVLVVALAFVLADPVDWAGDQVDDFTNPTIQPVSQGPARLGSIGSNNRWGWWEEAWEAFTDDPVGGAGAGTFRLVHFQLRDNSNVVTEPHDLPLQALAETGIVGFLLAAGAALTALVAIGRGLRRLEGEEWAAGLALAAAALLYPLHGLVDYDWDFIAVSAPFFFVVGVLLAAGAPVRQVRRPFEALAIAGVALAAFTSLITPWLADREADAARDSLAGDRAAEAADQADSARALNPFSVDPLFLAAEAAYARGDAREALRLYVRATELQPENWSTWYELGSFEAGLKSYDWAELHLARARELNPFGPAERDLRELRRQRRA